MSDVTQILEAVAHCDPAAADELLPLVYEDLRRLAAAKMAAEALARGRLEGHISCITIPT